ncbi:MAG: YbaB/EbfC family nucleoid-associated protein [Pseudochelatococcus sp.]|jgi:DNA-binding YbaB/EbfC family protein|uniref:YbaB/EbfC family nucleoid-associated protein n=1 Tax=Pseudochelatococcus sp. TaxID=2020869 RepID=UPI003D8D34FF
MRDIMGLMKQAQGLQQKMADVQAEFDAIEVEGTAGGGSVKVVANVKGLVKSVAIDPAILNPDDREIVEDLVAAAVNDARAKGERVVQDRMADLTKGLPIPPGLKLF